MVSSLCATHLIFSLLVSLITSQTTTTPHIDYCVGPLVHSKHPNPIQKYGDDFSGCGLSCESGKQIYGLSSPQQNLVDYFTIIGTILCLLGLVILSVNLYLDTKASTEKVKFTSKPILFHIPYVITLSTFILTLCMSISLIIGKETVVCYHNEFSVWNPGNGKSISCTIFGIIFYSSLLYYQLYALLLSFIVWRQFKKPMNPLWNIKDRYLHLFIFIIVLFLNSTSLATSSIDAIEPMGVCLPGVADKTQLFLFVVLPLLFSCLLSATFLILSEFLVKNNIDRHKSVSETATMKMIDLFQRILWYGFGVLFGLSLLVITGVQFYLKHDIIRDGLKDWIHCELQNYFLNMNVDCDSLRSDNHKISPFFFTTWIISCLMMICAQIILSFHSTARKRAVLLKQKTFNKISERINSPRVKNKKSTKINKMNKLETKSDESGNDDKQTTSQTEIGIIQTLPPSNGLSVSDNPHTMCVETVMLNNKDQSNYQTIKQIMEMDTIK